MAVGRPTPGIDSRSPRSARRAGAAATSSLACARSRPASFYQEPRHPGDGLPHRGGQRGGGEPARLPRRGLDQVVDATHQALEFPDFWRRRVPRRRLLPGDVVGDEPGVGAVGRMAAAAGQPGVLDPRRVADAHQPPDVRPRGQVAVLGFVVYQAPAAGERGVRPTGW